MRTPPTKTKSRSVFAVLALCGLLAGSDTIVLADGTETLGPPGGVALAAGSCIAVGGVGLSDTNGGSITVVLPTNAAVKQVLLYWHGASDALGGDAQIKVNAGSITGTPIGGPTQLFPGVFESAYRADITGLGLVGPGTNTLDLAEVDFSGYNNGAGVLVVYSNAAPATLRLVDGDDFALENYLSPLDRTEPQRFSFSSANAPRTAQVALLVGGSEGASTIRIWTGGQSFTFLNALTSANGPAWDSLVLQVPIPAGATNLTVQLFSGDGSQQAGQSSLISWVAAALSIPPGTSSGSNRPPRVVIYKAEGTYCATSNGTSSVRINGLVSDADRDTLTVDWFVNNVKTETDTVAIPSTRPQPIEFVGNIPVGTNLVYASVFDGTNTVYSATNKVVVTLDDTSPVIDCKKPKSKKANALGVAYVPGFGVDARDDCTPRHRLVKTQDPAPGTALGVGTYDITFTVADLAGNVATCTTQFTVTPQNPPKPPKPPKPAKVKKVKPMKVKPAKVKK